MKTRAEHLAFCKQRANELLDLGDIEGALASMASDLRKHPETARSVEICALGIVHMDSVATMRHFIEGFN